MTRYDLTRQPFIRGILRARWPQFLVQAGALTGFIFTILVGLFGTPVGGGNGVLAPTPAPMQGQMGSGSQKPIDFTEARQMLGASPALLQGKIIRGGMGTGMPSWGPIFTEAQSWAFADYLWTFQFEYAPYP